MRALTSDALGPPETYALQAVPVPEPGEGQVRLRVEAVALGYVDALIAAGRYQHKPTPRYVPGAEIVGVVDRVGRNVHGVAIGQRLASWQLLAGGGLAEFALAPARALVPVPDRLPAAVAASLLLDHLTAWYALFDRGGLSAGDNVLVLCRHLLSPHRAEWHIGICLPSRFQLLSSRRDLSRHQGTGDPRHGVVVSCARAIREFPDTGQPGLATCHAMAALTLVAIASLSRIFVCDEPGKCRRAIGSASGDIHGVREIETISQLGRTPPFGESLGFSQATPETS